MNAKSPSLFAVGALVLAALVALAGCAGTSQLQTTPASSFAPVANDDGKPVPLHTVKPDHPWQLRRDGITGSVTVRCLIDESGRVQEAEAIASTEEQFIKPALAAVRQWKFRPALREGRPVVSRVSFPISFQLDH